MGIKGERHGKIRTDAYDGMMAYRAFHGELAAELLMHHNLAFMVYPIERYRYVEIDERY